MIERFFRFLYVFLAREKEKAVFFDLPSSEKKKVVKYAVRAANKEQSDLVKKVEKIGNMEILHNHQ